MKLSHDCIRDILLFSESLPYNEPAFGDKIFKSDLLKKYSSEEINYAVSKLGDDDAQLIKGYVKFVSNKPYMTCISSLTFDGHKYLDNIRDPKIWKESKKISSKLASVSIDIMSEIAAKVITKTLGLD
ncbi:DUF2513 domain-containing protein [Enterococcus faecalis]|uniref:DUF2513 domain-containing protein n=1 Tax=Enterococcus faecalis TaxID=1351 RepID=UPI00132FAF19|nr:DUF2513 domain-containing protein [Enterococcus faecalis]MCU2264702.1 DUF2513 domain-containing protein [Enterococcus faecalis]QIJ69004.1 DUF2513 domain-containing protein [Enterococcus faecalis]QZT49339.1 DUF2513 domain-containing protein [Enterococcus faecalis]